ncbi:acyl-CoA dehydrogenase family protein [Pseudonocardia benzenivorans]|uniref:Acyl-CoA dehydrogenase family protein n=1 Tax=Pseudonocardia benzenivorans TaxID=228005 RepID=A0ABW3VQZ6_9PSEU|nr:BEC protein [Pseudonocardia sp. D17]
MTDLDDLPSLAAEGPAPIAGVRGRPPAELRALEDAIVERVRECAAADDFAERARVADRDGALAVENLRLMQEIGVTGMPIDPALGSSGASLSAAVRVMEELAYRDASTALAINMHWGGARGLAQMPSFPRRDEACAAIARHEATICGGFSISSEGLDSRKSGVVCRDEGDVYVFNGRSGYASMSEAAGYAMLGAILEGSDPDDPTYVLTVGRMGEPGLINHHNWNAMGMRATGSSDLECRDLAVVKDDCLVGQMKTFQFRRPIDTAYNTFGIGAIWVGLSRAAFDFTVDHAKRRYGYMASSSLESVKASYRADEPWAQAAIGSMDHWLGTGRALLRDMVDRLDDYDDDELMGRDHVRTLYHLRRMSEEVALGAMKTCGAHGYVKSRTLERIFRDLIGGVVMAWKTDDLQHKLGVGALGRPIMISGPGGT